MLTWIRWSAIFPTPSSDSTVVIKTQADDEDSVKQQNDVTL